MDGPVFKQLLDIWRDFIDNWRKVPPDAIVIAILGPSGSGKSTFINAAIGRQRCAVSPSPVNLQPVTTKPQIIYHKIEGKTIVFIDTPDMGKLVGGVTLFRDRTVDEIIYLCPLTNPRAAGRDESFD